MSKKQCKCFHSQLCITYFLPPGESSEVQVRQSFPLHGRGGQLLDPTFSKELSRIVTSQGAVVRYMRDGSIEVNKDTLKEANMLTNIYIYSSTQHQGFLSINSDDITPIQAHKTLASSVCPAGAVCRWVSQFQPGWWSRVGGWLWGQGGKHSYWCQH